MNGMKIRKGTLEPTRTWCRRWWSFLTSDMLPCDGILMVGQLKEKGGSVDECTYGIEELPPINFGWRLFLVRKLEADIGAEDEMYRTEIGPRGVSVCSCTAGKCRVEICKHRCAIAALIGAGVLPARELQGA